MVGGTVAAGLGTQARQEGAVAHVAASVPDAVATAYEATVDQASAPDKDGIAGGAGSLALAAGLRRLVAAVVPIDVHQERSQLAVVELPAGDVHPGGARRVVPAVKEGLADVQGPLQRAGDRIV